MVLGRDNNFNLIKRTIILFLHFAWHVIENWDSARDGRSPSTGFPLGVSVQWVLGLQLPLHRAEPWRSAIRGDPRPSSSSDWSACHCHCYVHRWWCSWWKSEDSSQSGHRSAQATSDRAPGYVYMFRRPDSKGCSCWDDTGSYFIPIK